jgi:hypothetical protein
MVRNVRIMVAKEEELVRLRTLRTAAKAFVDSDEDGQERYEELVAAVDAAREQT